MLPIWARDFVGIPYLSKGASFIGTDCWGLYRLIKAMQDSTHVPEYEYEDAKDKGSIEVAMIARHTWGKLDKPELGALLIFNIGGHPVHCGYCLDDKYMLHSIEGHASVVERFESKKWKNRLEGIYVYTE